MILVKGGFMKLSKEEKIKATSTKLLQKILFKHDKMMINHKLNATERFAEAKNYLRKMTPRIEELIKTADLNKIVFKGVKHIVFNKFDPENCFVDLVYKIALSPLMWAIKYKNYYFLNEMIKNGAKLDYLVATSSSLSNPRKIGPMTESINTMDKDLIAYLIEKGAKYDEKMVSLLKLREMYPEPKTEKVSAYNKTNVNKKAVKEEAEEETLS